MHTIPENMLLIFNVTKQKFGFKANSDKLNAKERNIKVHIQIFKVRIRINLCNAPQKNFNATVEEKNINKKLCMSSCILRLLEWE